jgi:hypothetical protein
MQWRNVRIFLVVFACCQLSAKGMGAMAAPSKSERAIWSIIAIVDGDARDAFLVEVTKFAEQGGFCDSD